jgi:2-polyprenyl-6-methoxyphenol hydroxylase-like FAD-dependent oxidoreductase/predicted DsbA family dithiol-disulfide isomerase
MKAVIIGGGIAGLTMALHLKRINWEVVVCEKLASIPNRGHAFLMNYEGLSVLSEFFGDTKSHLMKQHVNLFSLKRPNGEEKIKIQLNDWYCLKRIDVISFLYSFFTNDILIEGRSFSHFIYENNKAIAAVFENGEIEYGDVFFGADGSNSKVREAIFGKTNFSLVEVNEVVGISGKRISRKGEDVVFQKIQSKENGLAFGYIPSSSDEVVWFMQYDVKLSPGIEENNPESLKAFCAEMMKDFPDDVKTVLDATDFKNAYIWKTRDFDLLPSFHKENVVLIGDAAHLALPFTSAGTTNAIIDAKCVSESLVDFTSLEDAFNKYYKIRSPNIQSHVEQGRILKETFLNPSKHSERGFILPLVSDSTKPTSIFIEKPLNIIYYTDPICSTCWIIQPILRKLKLEYGDYLEIDYHMGGLLPSWKDYNKGIIKTPLDAAKHWEEVNESQKMFLDGDIWIEDPLYSSFPPSIAFKAAQLQDSDKAITFLRRLKELVFLEKKNITRWDIIENAALSSGLDAALLKRDFADKGPELFEADLELAKELEINIFPTLFFIKEGIVNHTIKGFQPYEKFEEIILSIIPDAVKKKISCNAETLFSMYNNMTEDEFSFLMDTSIAEAQILLNDLYDQGKIDKYMSKHGVVWMLNLNAKI